MLLYFQHSDGKQSLIADNVLNRDVALELIRADVADRNPNFRIYYIRSWTNAGVTTFDVGSHTEFYILKGEDHAPHCRN